MKTIIIQASKIIGKEFYVLEMSSTDEIEQAIFVEITNRDLEELNQMMEETL